MSPAPGAVISGSDSEVAGMGVLAVEQATAIRRTAMQIRLDRRDARIGRRWVDINGTSV